ncbi:hypothetical protein GCM10025861_13970 [Methanobacterium petrolearium]|nr:hypothetical protein GCM10025861_13970 [Methanobacterium petrolearium]
MVEPSIAIKIAPAKITASILVLRLSNIFYLPYSYFIDYFYIYINIFTRVLLSPVYIQNSNKLAASFRNVIYENRCIIMVQNVTVSKE